MSDLPNNLIDVLRDALRHLYDPLQLGKSALLALLPPENKPATASAFRRMLIDAVETLAPGPDVPVNSNAWITYHLLNYRYVEQLTQREVATDLGLSIRHLQRHEKRSLQILAQTLVATCGLYMPSDTSALEKAAPSEPNKASQPSQICSSTESELAWLEQNVPPQVCDLGDLLGDALDLFQPQLSRAEVRVLMDLPQHAARVAIQPVGMRQALLSLLATAIRFGQPGELSARISESRASETLAITLATLDPLEGLPSSEVSNLNLAQRLVQLSGGQLSWGFGEDRRYFGAQIDLPTIEEQTVIIVDDNSDTLRLYQRLLEGSHYRYFGLPSASDLFEQIETHSPSALIVDVMLPEVDGWQLLGHLRSHPQTRHVPVIVCTILHHAELALSLGAATFLHKPFTQESLLAALDQATRHVAPES